MGNSKESEETGEKQLDKEKKDEASKEPHLIKFLSTTWWDVIVYFISLVYYLTKLYAIFFCIPYLSYQWYFLNAASCTLHRLAGLDYEDEDKDTASRNGPATVFENSIIGERKLRSRHWVADAVLNRIISRVMDTPLIGLFLEMAGLKRELNLFRKIQKAFEGTSFSVTIRESGVPIRLLAVLTDINRLVDGELAPYLNLDNTYKEEDDPDYEPTDSSDDSLNENEHVKAINGNGSNGLKRVEESAKIGMKDSKTSPARQLEETTSPADKE
ncbi:hypothetical protein EGW08_020149 [Elysia chlorotica]|uniref:Uncharacterized protein n=1 Tax=Elysia chlorotica TaxID=188477 RepID=A0A433SS82_ELYCH|nr:hypothetical protein EGW08_020149 [Elysia chlorotica]